MADLRPDIIVTRKAISRLVGSLSDDAAERAVIAAKAAFEFIALDSDVATAANLFMRTASDPVTTEVLSQ